MMRYMMYHYKIIDYTGYTEINSDIPLVFLFETDERLRGFGFKPSVAIVSLFGEVILLNGGLWTRVVYT